jgi:membrane AbrB-like protein
MSTPLRLAALLALSMVLAAGLELLHLPAALLLGPLIASAVLSAANRRVNIPVPAFALGQSAIGCMIARSIPPDILMEVARDWTVFVPGILAVIVVGFALGWLLARWKVLPGTTAIWGSSPGAATPMILMAESYGADARLVAFMQYLRLVLVALSATVVARLWVGPSDAAAAAVIWFPPLRWGDFALTLLLVVVGAEMGRRVRLPAGGLLLPLGLAVLAQNLGGLHQELPPWFLAIAYAVAGWQIGSRFDRPILRHAARAFPGLFAGVMAMIVLCAGVAWLMVVLAGVDPLTAYLATSPGGADTVAIIAAGSGVDMAFVMAMQTARMVVVILTGPWIARMVANAQARQEAGRAGP